MKISLSAQTIATCISTDHHFFPPSFPPNKFSENFEELSLDMTMCSSVSTEAL